MGPLKKAALVLGVVGAAVGFGACFHDKSFENGQIQCSTDPAKLCPTGTSCVDGFCYHADLTAHVPSDAGTTPDAQ